MEYPDLKKLVVCRKLLEDPVVSGLAYLLSQTEEDRESEKSMLAARLICTAEQKGLSGNLLPACLLHLLIEGENTAAHTVELQGTYGSGLEEALQGDIALLLPFLFARTSEFTGYSYLDRYQPAAGKNTALFSELQKALPEGITPAAATHVILEHYRRYGRGQMVFFIAFRLTDGGCLVGIEDFPSYSWNDLVGYEEQKKKLLLNTRNFMKGKQANNVLLTGARGTGKSTGVKALANLFAEGGLRLIQITREQLAWVSPLLEKLGKIRNKKFLLFFDDLSFDEGESDYKYLKSAIDGSVTSQPDNVLIYATSNRRHLLKEKWEERNDASEAEVYRQDGVNENISLADRFGLILHYSLPSQAEYLAMIDRALRRRGIVLEQEKIRLLGTRWEMEHSGRNGRIAEQFARWYAGMQEF